MSSRLSNLNIATVSDIHLGNRRNCTEDIIKNLNKAFPDNAETAELDIIFLAGDVFDSLLTLASADIPSIKTWVARFLRMCKKNNTILRVLEGTPSHDWKQSNLFTLINTISRIEADVKHVTALSIEHIDRFDIDVLYVPDEWPGGTEDTFSQVVDLMHSMNLSKVDFAIMHGQFEYQLPSFIKAQKHNSDHYKSIVNELIFIGHIHTFSTNGKIIAQGSFDRLSHGEEEAKGHVRVKYDENGDKVIKFIENKNAKLFKTINCIGLDLEQILDKVTGVMKNLPPDTFIRIEAEKENPIFSTFEVLIRNFPLVTWTKLPRGDEEDQVVNILPDEEDTFIPINITRDNIETLMMNRMLKQGIPQDLLDESRRILLEVI